MEKFCDFCDEPFLDGESISFIARGNYKLLPSKRVYAVGQNFMIQELYHCECLNYILTGGK